MVFWSFHWEYKLLNSFKIRLILEAKFADDPLLKKTKSVLIDGCIFSPNYC